MRYPFVPLGLVFLLAACEVESTAPTYEPQVDIGHDSPEPNPNQDQDPVPCLKSGAGSSSAAHSGFEATRIPPVCPVL